MSVGNTTAAFMLSLPPIGTVHSLYNFPQEYLPMLQSKRVVRVCALFVSNPQAICCLLSAA